MVSSLTSTCAVPSVTSRRRTGPRRRVLPGRGGRRAKQGLLEADRAVGERITEPFPGNVMSMAGEDRSPFIDALRERVLVFDGAMGTSLQSENPTRRRLRWRSRSRDGWTASRSTRPRSSSACTAVSSMPGATSSRPAPSRRPGLASRSGARASVTRELNVAAAQLARRDRRRVLAGRTRAFRRREHGPDRVPARVERPVDEPARIRGPRARVPRAGGSAHRGWRRRADHRDAAGHPRDEGRGVRRARRRRGRRGRPVAIIASVSLDVTGRMLLGTDVAAMLAILESLHVDVIGLNCSTGPEHMREPIRYITSHTDAAGGVHPQRGPADQRRRTRALSARAGADGDRARELRAASTASTSSAGCCGSTNEHIRELVQACRRGRDARTRQTLDTEPRLASSMHAIELHQQPAPLLIGERVNAQGSRAVKRLLLADDYDGILGVARTQVEGGAHALDLCVAVTERSDEADQMRTVVKTLQMSIDAPLVIDSTDADVIHAALEVVPGARHRQQRQPRERARPLRRGAAARCATTAPASSRSPSTSRGWRAPPSASSRSRAASTTSRATSSVSRPIS